MIKETLKRPVPKASNYEVDEHGFIYRGRQRISQRYRSGRWYSQIRGDDGRNYTIEGIKLAEHVFGEDLQLSRNDILNSLKAKIIEEFPRYAITSYGAVYCIDPPRRGPKAGQRFLVSEKEQHGKKYVTLYHIDGRRRTVQVNKLVQASWGY